jgi:formylglycine-generating enzyme required for sulfatase activity
MHVRCPHCQIPAGSFGRQTPNPNDSPRRVEQDQTVILTRSIWFSDREVSRALFQQFLDDPSCPNEEKPKAWKGASHERSPTSEHPVHGASWIDSVLFCNWLSQKERLTPCYAGNGSKWELIPNTDGYRLPYEAEWEHAGRAGTATRYASGDDESLLSRYAVCLTNHTEICGNKILNGWGVFDVHGNVYEWCQDWYGSYGREGVLRNPTGPRQGIERVLRGGAINYVSTYASSEIRAKNLPAYRSITIGIRVARSHRDFNGEN